MYLPYEKQWTIFDRAQALGWAGHRPGVLGTFSSNKALDNALKFLQEISTVRDPKS